MEPKQIQQFQKMVQRHTKSTDTLKKLRIERKYGLEVKKMESIERMKRIEQSRLANDKELNEKLFDVSVKHDQRKE